MPGMQDAIGAWRLLRGSRSPGAVSVLAAAVGRWYYRCKIRPGHGTWDSSCGQYRVATAGIGFRWRRCSGTLQTPGDFRWDDAHHERSQEMQGTHSRWGQAQASIDALSRHHTRLSMRPSHILRQRVRQRHRGAAGGQRERQRDAGLCGHAGRWGWRLEPRPAPNGCASADAAHVAWARLVALVFARGAEDGVERGLQKAAGLRRV